MYVRTKNADFGWTEWQNLANNQSDTGWIPFNLINGTLANDAFKNESDNGFDCAYRIITNGSVTEKRVRKFRVAEIQIDRTKRSSDTTLRY